MKHMLRPDCVFSSRLAKAEVEEVSTSRAAVTRAGFIVSLLICDRSLFNILHLGAAEAQVQLWRMQSSQKLLISKVEADAFPQRLRNAGLVGDRGPQLLLVHSTPVRNDLHKPGCH